MRTCVQVQARSSGGGWGIGRMLTMAMAAQMVYQVRQSASDLLDSVVLGSGLSRLHADLLADSLVLVGRFALEPRERDGDRAQPVADANDDHAQSRLRPVQLTARRK